MGDGVNWDQIYAVYADAALGATDKAVWMACVLRSDHAGIYVGGVRSLAVLLRVKWDTVRRSLLRLADRGWIVPVGGRQDSRVYYVHGRGPIAADHAEDGYDPSRPVQEAPRMAMPPQTSARILHVLADYIAQVDAALTSDMSGVTEDQRRRWLVDRDTTVEIMDQFSQWLTRHPVPPT